MIDPMETNELVLESFDYDQFFNENTDEFHTMSCIESINSTNENLLNLNNNNNGDTPSKNRTTGIFFYTIVDIDARSIDEKIPAYLHEHTKKRPDIFFLMVIIIRLILITHRL